MLRYPGGKLRLMKKIDGLITNRYQPGDSEWIVLDVFTGGGGSLLNMAKDFPSWKFILNDKNSDMFMFWSFFASENNCGFESLFYQIRNIIPTVENHRRIFEYKPSSLVEAAFRIFFLNKTSYNGYITQCLPIGGNDQKGKWKVNCYWNAENIIKKIQKAREILDGKILSVLNMDAVDLLKMVNETFYNKPNFIYADPPYLKYGKTWYNCSFGQEDLGQVRNELVQTPRWCVSIDDNEISRDIFKEDDILNLDVKYTASSSYQTEIKSSNELVVFPKIDNAG